ncbi:MAG TPA: hypothetical protein VEA16_17180, partial [Vicinamibacterales bacterium]|nr:hypothetical protein [Vicinamibacterales bacterium]
DFIPSSAGDGGLMAALALAATVAAWLATMAARRCNRAGRAGAFYAGALLAIVAAAAGVAGLLLHPYWAGLNPRATVYASVIWLLAIWASVQAAIGMVMLLYCVARRLAGRMTAKYDMDIVNVELYWHFTAATILIALGITAGIPRLL